MLQNEIEEESTTQTYTKHAYRLNCHGPQPAADDESKDDLDAQFTELFFGKNNREFEQMAQKMIESVKNETPELDSGSSDSDEDDAKADSELRQAIPGFDSTPDEFKLFEVVMQSHPKQVMRYVPPSQQANLHPLWLSNRNKISGAPKCQSCGAPRQLEL